MHGYPSMDLTTVTQLLILVLVACTVHILLCDSYTLYGNDTDRLSLLEFKDAISLDPQQSFLSWNDSIHFCNWEGVICSARTPHRVTSLNLIGRGLVGQISPSLGNLSFLHSLVLTENTLDGEIPPSLGHLHRLETLRLGNNTLQGTIPSFANCSKLMLLEVTNNNLVGQFPADLPPDLQLLLVSVNNLTGTIPTSLANITTLTVISFSYNHITGNIPSDFSDLSSLRYLYAGANHLAGRFPHAVLNLSTVIGLSLSFNALSGEVPPNLFTSLPNLQRLQLDVNFFLGHIPSSFTNASGLSNFDLSSNNFTGFVPPMIGKLTKLSWLNLAQNQLQAYSKGDWEFLDNLANCTELKVFSMNSNHLSGHVPSSLGNLSNQLERLYLGGNQLSGDFPSGLANLRNIIDIVLWGNRFAGVVPKWIGTLKMLQILALHGNFFTGTIPSSLSNLSSLGGLYLNSNIFTGKISPSFGNFPMLQYLTISNNNLDDRIPMEILRIPTILRIDLSFNNLDGELPTDIGDAKQLVYLILSSNKLYGEIPNTLGDCESLEYIALQSNFFSGNIPTSLGNITSLSLLNLSANNLTGSIPTSLGDLRYLEKLDLSHNHLHGEVPTKGIFKNATAVRINGNQGLCGGASELHMPTCNIIHSNSTRHKESLVLKLVIPIGMVSIAMVIFVILLRRRKHNHKSVSLPSLVTKFPKVSYNDLARATQGFSSSNLIGSGRYSFVYQGKLFEAEVEVAVKVFNLETRGAQMSFIAECNALRNVRHRNLVPIITACSSIDSIGNDFKALVFAFMPRGDLNKLLHSPQENQGSSDLSLLTMAQRMSIIVDVADALEHLHHNNQGTMVHCDLKPSNILLDNSMTAHVGDFGLARFKVDSTMLSLGNPNSSSIGLVGTIGYAAPEYAGGGQISTAADVYSFGVVLLEIFLRKRPTDNMFKDELSIVKFIEISFPDRVMEIVDHQLIQELELCQETPMDLKEKGVRSLLSMLNIGLCCTKPAPGERINMHEVAAKLHGIWDVYHRGN